MTQPWPIVQRVTAREHTGGGAYLPRAAVSHLHPAFHSSMCRNNQVCIAVCVYLFLPTLFGSISAQCGGRSLALTAEFLFPVHRRPYSSFARNLKFLGAQLTPHKHLCPEKCYRCVWWGSRARHHLYPQEGCTLCANTFGCLLEWNSISAQRSEGTGAIVS